MTGCYRTVTPCFAIVTGLPHPDDRGMLSCMREWGTNFTYQARRYIVFKRAFVRMGLVLMLLLTGSAVFAQGAEPQDSDPYWRAAYWNNVSLSGTPQWAGTVASVDFDWGDGSPHPVVDADGFSARWTRYVDLPAGIYRFTATSDDGMRVYVDDDLVIDQWHDHPARTYRADISVPAGHHLIKVEYYENAGAAVAKVSWMPISQAGTWRGQYYDNRWLEGSPVMSRGDVGIAFYWGEGAPTSAMPSDNFSVRWSRTVPFQAGQYRFTASSDDGIRVYVDQRTIIDQWHDHPERTYVAETNLAGGPHEIVVEYYEHTGAAMAEFSWALISDSGGAWRAEYYANRWLRGTPALARAEQEIDFNWGYGSPGAPVPADGFSARWTRTLSLEGGLYRFTTTTDDGVRLWVNHHLLIDQWVDQAARSHSGTIYVSGEVPVVMEYYENGGAASARLAWTLVGDEPPPPPTPTPVPSGGEIVVDDADPGFVQGGSPTAWRTTAGGIGGSLTWTRNNDRARSRYNWARWYANLEPGRYEVYVYIPTEQATTAYARYWIAHYDGFSMRQVDQSAHRGEWVSLGTYRFRDRGAYVSLSDITYEPYLSTRIVFDAVKWSPR